LRNRSANSPLRRISTYFILATVVLFLLKLVQFSRLRVLFPAGMVVAGVPVGGLDRPESAQRLQDIYSLPVELYYEDAAIHLNPSVVGFQLDLEKMLAAADKVRVQQPFWVGFRNFLWRQPALSTEIPLQASYSGARLRAYLIDELAARYDKSPTATLPVAGTINFQPGNQGTKLDIERSISLIENALRSSSKRVVILPLKRIPPPRPTLQNLEILLEQTIDLSVFDGLAGLFWVDLQTGQEIHFLYRQGKELKISPDVAFTAASIIKIPIMVSVFKRIGENPDPETINLLEKMIERSGNDPADWVMERVIDRKIAPMQVSADMTALGLENTFLAGQFYPGAPLLAIFQTPANQRLDVNTDPDIYNQTTPSDIGMLLEDIYQCSQVGGGTLVAVFPGEITQTECQTMIVLLTRNKLGSLIEACVPEGTRVAHKHGWVTLFGIMNTLGDAGIVYTPGGNYVLVIFLHQPVQLLWEPASQLVADLSQAIYNFINLPIQ